jgi:protein-S-isoprenylcysteine O-methyltransferase Ste14
MSATHPVSALRLAASALYIAAWPALMFVLAGSLRWVEGWIFATWYIALCTTVIGWLYIKDPSLLAERYRQPGSAGQSARDKFIVYGLVIGFAAWIVVMPLDARRFRVTPHLPLAFEITGGAMLLASAFLFFRSFRDNTFLSALVRIQSERKQRVVSTGVYAFVRHPMYLGATLMFVGTPLLLGSAAGIVAGISLTLLLAFRITSEERVLEHDLDGYADYRTKVRHRLVPFVW